MQAAHGVPAYLNEVYWWAYVHPTAVRLFERQWLVNLILWGNFARLRDNALEALGPSPTGRTLQVACVYGDFSGRLLNRITRAGGRLDVVDVLPVQLDNLRRKLGRACTAVRFLQRDAADLGVQSATYDRAVLFFLLHEMPCDVRERTLAEALRVVKPGGEVVIVDYHRPSRWHPLRGLMTWILRRFEPFALDLWKHEVSRWLPGGAAPRVKRLFFGELYQLLIVRK